MWIRKAILLACLLLAGIPGARAETSRRDVGLEAPDGVDLKATYFAPAERGPGILLLHMCGDGGRKAWEGLASRLAESGFHVLTLDYRGFGESGGGRFEALDRERRRALMKKWPADFDVAFDFLSGRPRVDGSRVGIGGASCGVDNAIQLAIRHPQVRAVVALSGGTNQAGLDFLQRADSPRLFAAASADDSLVLPYVRWQMLFSRHSENKLVEFSSSSLPSRATRAPRSRRAVSPRRTRRPASGSRPSPAPSGRSSCWRGMRPSTKRTETSSASKSTSVCSD